MKVMWAYFDNKLLLHMFYLLLYSYVSSVASSPLYPSSCQSQGQFNLSGMHKAGDVVLGGLFGMHFVSVFPDLSFTSQPQQPTCHR